MKRTLKISGIIVVVIALLYLSAYISGQYLINSSYLKEHLQGTISKLSGRKVTLNGDIKFQVFPLPSLSIQGVTIDNPPPFFKNSSPYFAQIGQVSLSIKLWSLLTGKVRVQSLKLKQANLYLVTNQAGQHNWQITIAHSPSSTVKPNTKTNNRGSHPTKTKASSQQWSQWLFPIDIGDANIHFINQQTGKNLTLHNINLNLQPDVNNQQIKLSIDSQLKNNTFKKSVPINISADIGYRNQQLSLHKGQLRVGDFVATATLQNSNLATRHFVGRLTIAPFNLQALASSIGQTLPGSKLAWGQMQAQMKFEWSQNALNIPEFHLTLNRNKVDGHANIVLTAKPMLSFQLEAKTLNIDPFLNHNKTLAPTTTNSNTIVPHARPSFDTLAAINWHGSVLIKTLIAHGLHFNNVSLQTSANNGVIQLAPLKLHFEQGVIQANTVLTAQHNNLKINNSIAISRLPLAPLLSHFANINNFRGLLTLRAKQQTVGHDPKSWLSHLNGQGSVTINNGVIKGIDIQHTLDQGMAMISKKAQHSKNHGQTKFDNISGQYQINSGMIHNRNFLLKIGGTSITANGTINLNDSALSMELNANYDAGDKHWRIPLKLSGTIQHPHLGLNKQAIAALVLRHLGNVLLHRAAPKLNLKGFFQ